MSVGDLIVEPDEYRVEWQIPGGTGALLLLPGDVRLEADAAPTGTANGSGLAHYESQGGGSKYATFPQHRSVDVLKATAVNGFAIALLDAEITIWTDGVAIIRARSALVGRRALPDAGTLVHAADIQVEGLDALTAVAPIHGVTLPGLRSPSTAGEPPRWEAVGNLASTQRWSDKTADLNLSFHSSSTAPNGFLFRVTFTPILQLTPREPLPMQSLFSDWIEPIRRIVSLSTGRAERLTFVRVHLDEDHSHEYQVFGTAIFQAPYVADANAGRSLARAFLIGPNHLSLLELVRRWQELAMQHHPLLETYGSMMYARTQHPRNQVLLLIQALEGMHGFEHRADWEAATASHEARRDEVLASIEGEIDADAWRFVKRHLAKVPIRSLQTVLRDALTSLPVDLTPQLEQTALVKSVAAGDARPASTYDALRRARNDLAHGNRGFDVGALHEVAQVLDRVVRSHMLRVLGCPTAALEAELTREPS